MTSPLFGARSAWDVEHRPRQVRDAFLPGFPWLAEGPHPASESKMSLVSERSRARDDREDLYREAKASARHSNQPTHPEKLGAWLRSWWSLIPELRGRSVLAVAPSAGHATWRVADNR